MKKITITTTKNFDNGSETETIFKSTNAKDSATQISVQTKLIEEELAAEDSTLNFAQISILIQ